MDELNLKFKIEANGKIYDIPNIQYYEWVNVFYIIVDKETVLDFKDTNIIRIDVTFPEGQIISRELEDFNVENIEVKDSAKVYYCSGNIVVPNLKAF